MYRYDEFDSEIVQSRVQQFRGQVERRLTGALTEDQFKPLRLMNGLYMIGVMAILPRARTCSLTGRS